MLLRYKGALLSWIAIPVSVAVFFWFLTGLITISYHPIAPGIHLIPVRIAFAAIGVLACIVLAIRHSIEKRRTLVLRNALELTAVPALLWITFQITAAIYQQPDQLRLTYKGETYNIPRVYSPGQSPEHTSYDYMKVSVCYNSRDPVYGNSCNSTNSIELSTRAIGEKPYVHASLDRAGATYDGDVVTSRGSGAVTLSDGSFNYSQGVYQNRFLLDDSGQIERFAHCYPVTKTCYIVVRTPNGILTFPAKMTDTSEINFWRDEEADWLATFEGWKCAETTCGGQFD